MSAPKEARDAQVGRDTHCTDLADALRELDQTAPRNVSFQSTSATENTSTATSAMDRQTSLAPDWMSFSSELNESSESPSKEKAKLSARGVLSKLRSATSVTAFQDRFQGRSKSVRMSNLMAVRNYEDSQPDLVPFSSQGTSSRRSSSIYLSDMRKRLPSLPSTSSGSWRTSMHSCSLAPDSSSTDLSLQPACQDARDSAVSSTSLSKRFSLRNNPAANYSFQYPGPANAAMAYHPLAANRSSLPAAFAKRVNRQVEAINKTFSTQFSGTAQVMDQNEHVSQDRATKKRTSTLTSSTDGDQLMSGYGYNSPSCQHHQYDSSSRPIQSAGNSSRSSGVLRSKTLNDHLGHLGRARMAPSEQIDGSSATPNRHSGLHESETTKSPGQHDESINPNNDESTSLALVHSAGQNSASERRVRGHIADQYISLRHQPHHKPGCENSPASIESLRKVTPPSGQYSAFDPAVPVPMPLKVKKFTPPCVSTKEAGQVGVDVVEQAAQRRVSEMVSGRVVRAYVARRTLSANALFDMSYRRKTSVDLSKKSQNTTVDDDDSVAQRRDIGLGIDLGDNGPDSHLMCETPTKPRLRRRASKSSTSRSTGVRGVSWDGLVDQILAIDKDPSSPTKNQPAGHLSMGTEPQLSPPSYDSPNTSGSYGKPLESAAIDESLINFARPLSTSDLLLSVSQKASKQGSGPKRDGQHGTKHRDVAMTEGDERELRKAVVDLEAMVRRPVPSISQSNSIPGDEPRSGAEQMVPQTPQSSLRESGRTQVTDQGRSDYPAAVSPSMKWNARFPQTPRQLHVPSSPFLTQGQLSPRLDSPSVFVDGIGPVVYNKHNGQLGLESPHLPGDISEVFGVHPAFRGESQQAREDELAPLAPGEQDTSRIQHHIKTTSSGSNDEHSGKTIHSNNSTSGATSRAVSVGEIISQKSSGWQTPLMTTAQQSFDGNDNADDEPNSTPSAQPSFATSTPIGYAQSPTTVASPNGRTTKSTTIEQSSSLRAKSTRAEIFRSRVTSHVQATSTAFKKLDGAGDDQLTSLFPRSSTPSSPLENSHNIPSLPSLSSLFSPVRRSASRAGTNSPSPLASPSILLGRRTPMNVSDKSSMLAKDLSPTSSDMSALRKQVYSLKPIQVRSSAPHTGDTRIHPSHPFLWNTRKLYCLVSHEGQCAICFASCCVQNQLATKLATGLADMLPGGSAAAQSTLEVLKQVGGVTSGIDSFAVFVKCTECQRIVCTGCAGKCPVIGCGDVVCKFCEPSVVFGVKWKGCSWHERESGVVTGVEEGGVTEEQAGGNKIEGVGEKKKSLKPRGKPRSRIPVAKMDGAAEIERGIVSKALKSYGEREQ